MFKSFVQVCLIFVFIVPASVPVEADENDGNGAGFFIGAMNAGDESGPAIMFDFSNQKNNRKFTFQIMEFFGGNYRDLSLLYGFARKRKSYYTSISAGIHFFDDRDDVYDTTGLAYELEVGLLPGRKKNFGFGIKLRGSVNSTRSFSGLMVGMRFGF